MEILWISHVLIDMEMRSWLKVFYLRTNWLKTLKGVDKRQIKGSVSAEIKAIPEVNSVPGTGLGWAGRWGERRWGWGAGCKEGKVRTPEAEMGFRAWCCPLAAPRPRASQIPL